MFFSNNTTQKSKQILPAKFIIHCTNNLINEIPEVAGNFDIKFKIGAGTFGTVYAASLKQNLDKWFALKHINSCRLHKKVEGEIKCLHLMKDS